MLSDVSARLIGALVTGYVGFRLGETIAEDRTGFTELAWRIAPPIGLFLLAAAVTPVVVRLTWSFLQRQVGATRPETIVLGTAGLFAGLVVAALLSFPLGPLPTPFGDITPFIATVALAAAGVAFFAGREAEVMEFLSRYAPVLQSRLAPPLPPGNEHILDTSAIIDGRIAEICETGFVDGSLVVPGFVLDELRHIADATDEVRRSRGRRGLEILTRMQREGRLPLTVVADDGGAGEVDARLVRMALERHAPIITNDFNLDRVAQLQGVRVLNVNRLGGALKSTIAPGEGMHVRVVQEGREADQGVAFLDDGTMIVVENGKRYLNESIEIVVTRILQTAAGRLVFAQPRASAE